MFQQAANPTDWIGLDSGKEDRHLSSNGMAERSNAAMTQMG